LQFSYIVGCSHYGWTKKVAALGRCPVTAKIKTENLVIFELFWNANKKYENNL